MCILYRFSEVMHDLFISEIIRLGVIFLPLTLWAYPNSFISTWAASSNM